MSRDASMIVMSDFSVRWSPNTDSHSEIIHEFGLPNLCQQEAPWVGVEIVPPGRRFDTPPDQWIFFVADEYTGILPGWWDAKRAEQVVRAVLPQWIAECVVLPGQVRECVTDGHRRRRKNTVRKQAKRTKSDGNRR